MNVGLTVSAFTQASSEMCSSVFTQADLKEKTLTSVLFNFAFSLETRISEELS